MLHGLILGICCAEEANPVNEKNAEKEANQVIADQITELIQQSVHDARENIKPELKKLLQASAEDRFEILVSLNQKHPDDANLLNLLALLTWHDKKFDDAKKYIDASLKIEKSDRSLEVFALVYFSMKDLQTLYENRDSLESVEKKSNFLMRLLLALSDKYSDVELYQRTSDYIKDNKIDDPEIIRDQKKATTLLLEKGKKIEVEKQ